MRHPIQVEESDDFSKGVDHRSNVSIDNPLVRGSRLVVFLGSGLGSGQTIGAINDVAKKSGNA